MDIFVEQIVKKPPTVRDTLLKFLIFFGMTLLSVFFIIILFPTGALFLIITGYLTYFLTTSFDYEYEYIVTNGELDIDKIIGKRKRRRLLSIKAKDFTNYGELRTAPAVSKEVTQVMANGLGIDGKLQNKDYFAEFNHKTLGKTRLVFSPDERVLNALSPYIPRNIKNKGRF